MLNLKQVFDSIIAVGDSIEAVTVTGSASPDGPLGRNKILAQKRAELIADFIVEYCGVERAAIQVSNAGENWPLFFSLLPGKLSDAQIVEINNLISSVRGLDARERELRTLDEGKVWKILVKDVFPAMRISVVEVDTVSGLHTTIPITENFQFQASVEDDGITKLEPELAPEPQPEYVEKEETPVPVEKLPGVEPYHWYIKTNLPTWAMLIFNLQAEIDVANHFSVMLPIYYSGFNYFKRTLKFRTFTVLPEARYWFNDANQGLFIGGHFGFSYYNYAKNGDWRYQDHDGNSPAYGGGITLGYRLPIRNSSPWQFEFSVGGGVYHLDYDVFVNRNNGFLVGRRQRTFFGLDNVAVSLCYRFNMTRKRKGGTR